MGTITVDAAGIRDGDGMVDAAGSDVRNVAGNGVSECVDGVAVAATNRDRTSETAAAGTGAAGDLTPGFALGLEFRFEQLTALKLEVSSGAVPDLGPALLARLASNDVVNIVPGSVPACAPDLEPGFEGSGAAAD